MNRHQDASANEQGTFIASQVADFANNKIMFNKFLQEVSNPKALLAQNSVKDNLALVQIIVKAGLYLLQDGPSLHPEHESLFAGSLSAICTIIAETPDILTLRVRSGAVDGQDELWIWLLHHLVNLLIKHEAENMLRSVCQAATSVLKGLQDHCENSQTFSLATMFLLKSQEEFRMGNYVNKFSGISEASSDNSHALAQVNVLMSLAHFVTATDRLENLYTATTIKSQTLKRLNDLVMSDATARLNKQHSSLFILSLVDCTASLGSDSYHASWLSLVRVCFTILVELTRSPETSLTVLPNVRPMDLSPSLTTQLSSHFLRIAASLQQLSKSCNFYTHETPQTLFRILLPVIGALPESMEPMVADLRLCLTPEEVIPCAVVAPIFRKQTGKAIAHPILERLVAVLDLDISPSNHSLVVTRTTEDFFRYSDEMQAFILRSFGWIACSVQSELRALLDGSFVCNSCDNKKVGLPLPPLTMQNQLLEIACLSISKNDVVRDNPTLRVALMRTICKMAIHAGAFADRDINKSPLLRYLHVCLGDPSRHVRMLTGVVLTTYFLYSNRIEEEKVYLTNRRRIFDMLRKQSGDAKSAETLLLIWSSLGRISRPDDMQLILLTLVDHLCHQNIFIRQSTVLAINKLASALNQSTYMLFSPYMRYISIQILDRSEKQPELINAFSNILGITATDFLTRNQQYLLPPMVLHGMHEHIASIARGTRRGVKETLLDNMAYILSHLLTSGYIKDGGLVRFLSAVDAAFGTISVDEVINSHPIPLAAELLQLFAEKSLKRETILAALSQVAHISIKITSSTRKTPRELAQENLRSFLRKHSLGIVSQCEESMNGYRGRRGLLDRSRYITAIGELISLLERDIEHAVPQITACLQSAMAEGGLRYVALKAWEGLLQAMPDENCTSLIPYTVCLFLNIFPDSTDDERLLMKEMLTSILFDRNQDANQIVGKIPTLRYKELSDVARQLSEETKHVQSKRTVLSRLTDVNTLCVSDNPMIALEGLREMKLILTTQEAEFHNHVLKELKDRTIQETMRNLLDIITKFKGVDEAVQLTAAECLGIAGAVDPVREDGAKKIDRNVVLHNFADENAEETVNFVRILLENQLVNAFRSATRSNVQIFLAWAIQELLKFCGFDESVIGRSERNPVLTQETRERWQAFSPTAREIMTPLLTSKYDAGERSAKLEATYPIFESSKSYNSWLFLFLYDLLQSAQGENARKLFGVFARILREEETTISNFLLPYVFLNVCVTCTEQKRDLLLSEIITILTPSEQPDTHRAEYRRMASESIFAIVDYLSLWSRTKKIWNFDRLADRLKRQNRHILAEEEDDKDVSIIRVQSLTTQIPAKLMAQAALSCGSYSRALFYWEQHIRNERDNPKTTRENMEPLLAHLQQLYININDPDGIEGVSSCLSHLSLEQEILMHENAGRWTAAQSTYELALQRNAGNQRLQAGLLNCLKETGHHEILLYQANNFIVSTGDSSQQPLVDLALESSISLGQWQETIRLLSISKEETYNTLLSKSLISIRQTKLPEFRQSVDELKKLLAQELASRNPASTWQCYDTLVKLAVVHEVEQVTYRQATQSIEVKYDSVSFQNRLMIMANTGKWRQHLLTVRRALYGLQAGNGAPRLQSSIWLESAKLARKTGQSQQAYKAILNALESDGTPLARIEHARWWWKEGHQMRAIQILKKALEAKAFDGYQTGKEVLQLSIDHKLTCTGKTAQQALISKAELLLTRWNDLAEHANSEQQLKEYSSACKGSQLEKPYYFLGRYYLRLLNIEAKKPAEQQDMEYISGRYHRQIVLSYGQAMHYGTKYIFQTLPSFLQLWLDFGHDAKSVSQRAATTSARRAEILNHKRVQLDAMNKKLKTYLARLPAYLFLLAFPQILSRINHSDKDCYSLLEAIVLKCLRDYPRQALWPFMAVCKSRDTKRSSRGNAIIGILRDEARNEAAAPEDTRSTTRIHNLKYLSQQAQDLTDQLMRLCTYSLAKNKATLSLSKDIDFDMRVAPSYLVVPVQTNLTVVLPAQTGAGHTKHHRAFEDGQPTIVSFRDEVDVMASLQRPRKITIRASDGQQYPFLVKPNDDLRKDARLMDFNGVIQKFIRRDSEALARQMSIRTYAVIALNEDHGFCEWVRNTRPLRDILVKTYAGRNIQMQYGEVKKGLEKCLLTEQPGRAFERDILKAFPPTFHDWFVEKFAEPSQWFAARMSYSRTLAVMSMVGFVLGLGDRHGENILFDETTGDAVHVDFNCLFEKGHTFEKPEKVPFRLTHNMVDALGVTGVEGSFRKTCEITLRILRENQDAFNTVLESFLHDPVGEFLKKVKKSANGEFEKAEAMKVLSVIASKLKGSAGSGIADKHVPLSIEGQADELIKQATDSSLLVQMYIGWTAWL